MADFPSTDDLRARYRDEMENEAITAVGNWKLRNTDEPTDEAKYVENGKQIAPEFFPVVDKALEKI